MSANPEQISFCSGQMADTCSCCCVYFGPPGAPGKGVCHVHKLLSALKTRRWRPCAERMRQRIVGRLLQRNCTRDCQATMHRGTSCTRTVCMHISIGGLTSACSVRAAAAQACCDYGCCCDASEARDGLTATELGRKLRKPQGKTAGCQSCCCPRLWTDRGPLSQRRATGLKHSVEARWHSCKARDAQQRVVPVPRRPSTLRGS